MPTRQQAAAEQDVSVSRIMPIASVIGVAALGFLLRSVGEESPLFWWIALA